MFFPFLCLLFLNFILAGCTANLFLGKLSAAEDKLSYGKSIGDDLEEIPPMMPPSVIARHRIASALDYILQGDYNYRDITNILVDIRQDPYVPRYLKVEAGYILVLVEKIERQRRTGDETSKKYNASTKDLAETVKKYDRCQQENERLKDELKELKYKLEKIEEIHLDIEKRRGK